MTDHSKYSGPYPQIEPVEVDIGAAWRAATELIRQNAVNQVSPPYLIAIAIVAAGAMISGAICQLDATIRRRE